MHIASTLILLVRVLVKLYRGEIISMAKTSSITQERLKEVLDYDSSTGIFTWKKNGSITGTLNSYGYVIIKVDGIPHRAHRLAWLYVYGDTIPEVLDHIDSNRSNNSIDNLRVSSKSERSRLQKNAGLDGTCNKSSITQEKLKEILDYDSATGVFTWKKNGKIAGSRNKKKYVLIMHADISYRAHRLAWLYVYGDPIPDILDHIDGNRENNAIDNLRACTHSENNANRKLSDKSISGLKGVSYDGKKWAAFIKKDGKSKHLGSYSTKEEAYSAYCKEAKELFGEYARFD